MSAWELTADEARAFITISESLAAKYAARGKDVASRTERRRAAYFRKRLAEIEAAAEAKAEGKAP